MATDAENMADPDMAATSLTVYRREQWKPEHAYELEDQHKHRLGKEIGFRNLDRSDWDNAIELGIAISGFRDDVLLGSGGIICLPRGCIRAWSMFSLEVNRFDMLWLHREALRLLDALQTNRKYERIEVSVRTSFKAANRWVRLLGFVADRIQRSYQFHEGEYMRYIRSA